VLLSLAALVLCTLLGGCMSAGLEEQSDRELLPWSEPAAWERTTLGVPF
jgi:hypothetical protein